MHDHPGTVNTPLLRRMDGLVGVLMRAFIYLVGYWKSVPIEECGERHLFLATSGRYPPAVGLEDSGSGVLVGDGVDLAKGTTGEVGSGVYSVEWDGASASPAVQQLLAGYRSEGIVEEIWRHAEGVFDRVARQDRSL